jgi:hypothetical protein
MTRQFRSWFPVGLALALASGACGGGSPSSPSAAQATGGGVVLRGSVISALGAVERIASGSSVITVTVKENSAITTTVGADGTFTLRGLPEGRFTLVFTNGTTPMGTVEFAGVLPNQEIIVTVSVSSSSVTVLEERRNGIGHGDIEIEGLVEAVLVPSAAGESRFTIAGKTVVVRPGDTAIREGNTARTVADVKVGRQVHVKGVWLAMEATGQPVLAHEIKLQDSTGTGGGTGGDNGAMSWCPAAGANAEVEGIIKSKGGNEIVVDQQGKGEFQCKVGNGVRIRKGNREYKLDDLKAGWRVHVKGTGLGAAGGACRVDADEIMVQQD